jgi:hypothetical protein
MKKTSLQDCTLLGTNQVLNSEYVIIDCERNTGNRASGFNIAYEGGFLEYMGDSFYKVKRIVANNLELIIMSEYPAKM